jgi:hypothetical protein
MRFPRRNELLSQVSSEKLKIAEGIKTSKALHVTLALFLPRFPAISSSPSTQFSQYNWKRKKSALNVLTQQDIASVRTRTEALLRLRQKRQRVGESAQCCRYAKEKSMLLKYRGQVEQQLKLLEIRQSFDGN